MAVQLDLSLDPLEENLVHSAARDLITKRRWSRTTHFSKTELAALLLIYFKIIRIRAPKSKREVESMEMSRQQFNSILHKVFGMPDDFLHGRIGYALGVTAAVSREAWVHVMNVFLRGTLRERIDYCYTVYDVIGQRLIRREQMMTLLRRTVYKHDVEEMEEAIKDLVDIILGKMDLDHDGKISYDDYRTTVLAHPDMLECFGQCLPDRLHVYSLLATFTASRLKF